MKTKSMIRLATTILALLAFFGSVARADDIQPVFEKNCAACHGKDGKGNTRMGRQVDVKDYTDPKVQADLSDEKALKTIKEGIKDDKGKERMKPYGDLLTDDQIKSLIAYIRTFKK